jgi:hypothetical protein
MKTIVALLAIAGVTLLNAAGQSTESGSPTNNSQPKQPDQPSQADLRNLASGLSPQKLRAMAEFQTTTMTRVLGLNLDVDGVLPRMIRADHPLHLINPFAPAKYGTGWENVNLDPRTQKIEGISFFSFHF